MITLMIAACDHLPVVTYGLGAVFCFWMYDDALSVSVYSCLFFSLPLYLLYIYSGIILRKLRNPLLIHCCSCYAPNTHRV